MSTGQRTPTEFRVLDSNGCLTAAAMCLCDELGAEQQAVVARHVRSCLLCAQQQASLSAAAQRVRRARPRLALPTEVRQLGRQAVLRGLGRRRRQVSIRARTTMPPRPRVAARVVPWWAWVLFGLTAGSAAFALALWLSR